MCKTFAKLLKYFLRTWDDAGCEIRFEKRIWLVEKINKLGNTLQNPGPGGELKF